MSQDGRALARAMLVVLALHLVGLGAPRLIEPDEGRYADIARTIVREGCWIAPRVNGVAFVDKPPLVLWLVALSLKAFGPGELALRLVPALSGIAAAAGAAWLAREVYGRGAALAAIAYATCPLALGVGRFLVLDAPLAALVTWGLAFVLRGAGVLRGPPSHAWSAVGGVLLGLGVLVKGPVAIGLAGLGVIVALVAVLSREGGTDTARRLVLRLLSPVPWVTAVLVATPWFLLAEHESPGFLRVFFLEENLRRFGGTSVEHTHGPLYFVGVMAWGLAPWLVAAAALLAGLGGARAADPVRDRGRATLLGFAALVVVFFSLSSTKVEYYVLPAFPALAAVLGGEISLALEQRGRASRLLGATFGLAAALIVLASLGGVVVGLRLFELTSPRLALFQRAAVPWLAFLPVPLVVIAVRRARAGRPVTATTCLALAVVAFLPFMAGPLSVTTSTRSAEPVGTRIATLRRKGEKVASYHYYYRGLPYFLDGPVVLLGEKGELHDGAFAARPDLFFQDAQVAAFLRENRPLLVAVPWPNHRAENFKRVCAEAGVEAEKLWAQDDDIIFEVP